MVLRPVDIGAVPADTVAEQARKRAVAVRQDPHNLPEPVVHTSVAAVELARKQAVAVRQGPRSLAEHLVH